MRALNTKLRRNIWQLKGQGLAIALVIASGVATLIIALATLDSLRVTQSGVYRDLRFAEVFADLKRAPESLAVRLRDIPGVAVLETRVKAPANIRLDGFPDPVTGMLVSIPDGRQPELNRLFLRAGELPAPDRDDQAVLSEAFAEAHGLQPGDRLEVIINGRYQRLTISGIGQSPEYIYQIRPGELFPDFARYAILWMNRSALGAAYGMEGAFNSVAATRAPGRGSAALIEAMDLLLEPWGGLGAHDRDDQYSHRYLSEEMQQLAAMARILPAIFLAVAAFLLNVVTARLIRTQREQIAVLKAFGYDNFTVALHYLALVSVIILIGALLGVLLGAWAASGLGRIYAQFFRFPYLDFHLRPGVALLGIAVAGGAAILGTLGAVRAAFRLPPAEAMRPEPPAVFRATLLERLGLTRWLDQPSRIVLRNLERTPVRSALSVLGISLAVGIMMVSGYQQDAINHMINVQFRLSQQQDVTVALVEPTSTRVVHELAAQPGVRHAEGWRVAPAVLRHGHREYRTSLQGYTPDSRLFRLLDRDLRTVELPAAGMLITDHLGTMLGVGVGDSLQVQILDGRRQRLEIPVTGLVREYVGVNAYLRADVLARLLGEGPAFNGAFLAVEDDALEALFARLDEMPRVAGVTLRRNAIDSFRETMGETILVFTFVNMLLAGSIAVAVVYNSARIALAERGREMASLRVLGFTRGEVSFILLGELLLLTLLAMPLGFAFGTALCWLMAYGMQTDIYRVPLVLESSTYALAALVILVAALGSALLVGRQLRQLDMVSALKAME